MVAFPRRHLLISILFGRLIFASVLDHESGISNYANAVIGTVARLPCDTRTSIIGDVVDLIIWYKQPDKDPICSYDNRRNIANDKTASWCNDGKTNGRAEFIFSDKEHGFSSLLLKQVLAEDEAIYRCRVDFKKSPTRNYNVNFTVIVPPNSLTIMDDKGTEVKNGILGPYTEGSSVTVTCLATGGRPPPRVTWWKEHALLDNSYVYIAEANRTENSVIISKINRHHLNTIFTCQAANNNLSAPISSTVNLRVFLQPLWIRLKGNRKSLSAGSVYEITCQVVGAYPIPAVTWWKGNSKLKKFEKSDSSDGNVTISRLSFVPESEDNGKNLTCKIEPPVPSTAPFQDSWKLNVTYVPVSSLTLGRNINSSAIKEGIDVYFECTMNSNPPTNKIMWKHNGNQLYRNTSAGILFSNQTLVLQKVTRLSSGLYSCVATNAEGDGESNSFYLDVKFRPVCYPNQKNEYGVGRGELAKIKCEVEANPPQVEFVWKFGNTSLPAEQFTSDGTRSIAVFAPITELDYGQLQCSASNSIGFQKESCIYNIIPAGFPDEVDNCTLINQTFTSFDIRCDGGFDGGLPQRFLLTAYHLYDYTYVRNISEPVPHFLLTGLEPGTAYRIEIRAFNAKGHSRKIELKAMTLRLSSNEAAQFAVFLNFPALLSILFGIILLLVLLTCIIIITVRSQDRRKKRRRKQQMEIKSNYWYNQNKDKSDKNPDIIPNKNDYIYETGMSKKSDDARDSEISLITENHFKYNQEHNCHRSIKTEHKRKHNRKKSSTITINHHEQSSSAGSCRDESTTPSYSACDQPCPPHLLPSPETPLLSTENIPSLHIADGGNLMSGTVRCCIHDPHERESFHRF